MAKKKKARIVAIGLACVLFVVVICIYATPWSRVSLFVHSYHQLIEESLAGGHGVPADDAVLFGYKYVNSWDAEHPMTEFVIMSRGDTYYGCYYSPDDVPLAFQNTDVELIQNGHDYWEWSADGDNHGATSFILKNWYYFEASF